MTEQRVPGEHEKLGKLQDQLLEKAGIINGRIIFVVDNGGETYPVICSGPFSSEASPGQDTINYVFFKEGTRLCVSIPQSATPWSERYNDHKGNIYLQETALNLILGARGKVRIQHEDYKK